jgi:hypothetical protein
MKAHHRRLQGNYPVAPIIRRIDTIQFLMFYSTPKLLLSMSYSGCDGGDDDSVVDS